MVCCACLTFIFSFFFFAKQGGSGVFWLVYLDLCKLYFHRRNQDGVVVLCFVVSCFIIIAMRTSGYNGDSFVFQYSFKNSIFSYR